MNAPSPEFRIVDVSIVKCDVEIAAQQYGLARLYHESANTRSLFIQSSLNAYLSDPTDCPLECKR